MKPSLKVYSLVTILLQAILLFCPGCFLEIYWLRTEFGTYERQFDNSISFLDGGDTMSNVLSYITLGLLVLSFLCYFYEVRQKNYSFSKSCLIFPIINLIALIGNSLSIDTIFVNLSDEFTPGQFTVYRYTYDINWLFYIILALSITTFVFAILIKCGKGQPQNTAEMNVVSPTNVAPTFSTVEVIKQYKDLLDCGAITQEEYEAQKNKLLGSNQ